MKHTTLHFNKTKNSLLAVLQFFLTRKGKLIDFNSDIYSLNRISKFKMLIPLSLAFKANDNRTTLYKVCTELFYIN